MKIDEFIKRNFGSIEIWRATVKESHSLLPEGAWTNEGLFWISPKGKVILVNTVDDQFSMSHEEYANKKWNCSLEDALHRGYIRLQALSPKYLFVDHTQQLLRSTQVPPMTGFFFDQQMKEIPYKEMAIERAGNMKSFTKGQNNVALQFVISGEIEEELPPISSPSNISKQMDLDTMAAAYKRPGVNPFGDSTDYSFARWIAERKKE